MTDKKQTKTQLNPDQLFGRQGFGVHATGQLIGVSTKTVWRLIKAGALGYRRIGKRIIVGGKDIDEFLATRAVPAGKAKQISRNILSGKVN